MRTIRGFLLAALVAGSLLTVGCQGADYPSTDGANTASSGHGATAVPASEATVTEHSAVLPGCYNDNVSATENWWWTRAGSPSQGVMNGIQLHLSISNPCAPNIAGTISGQMYWKWVQGNPPQWVNIDPSWSWWNGPKMNFQVQAFDTLKWYDFDCTFKTGTSHNWSCGFYEWNDIYGWLPDGTMQLYQ
jgi:hypothetical protein